MQVISNDGSKAALIRVGQQMAAWPADLLEQADCLLPAAGGLAVEVAGQEVADQVHLGGRKNLCAAVALAEQAQGIHPYLSQQTQRHTDTGLTWNCVEFPCSIKPSLVLNRLIVQHI